MKQKNIKGLISEYFIFLIFIALVVVLTCLKPSFIAPTNLVNILKQASINGILAFGMMFVIIAGGFDMSVGSTVAFTGILAALLGKGDLPLIVPLVVAMLAGLAVGMVNGIGVAIGDLPPFIMTLGSMTAVRGLALLTSNGKPITGISKEYKAVAASSIAGIPMLSVFLVIVIIICAFVLSKTVYGRRVYACGGTSTGSDAGTDSGADSGSDSYKIALIQQHQTNAFQIAVSEAAEAKADELGVDLTILSADQDAATQISQIEQCVSEGYDAILFEPVDPDGLADAAKSAADSGVVMINIISACTDWQNNGISAVSYGNNVKAGETEMEQVAKLLNGKGNIAILTGPSGDAGGLQRMEGYENILKNYPEIKQVVAPADCQWDTASAQSTVESWLSAYDLDAIVCENDGMAVGAGNAAGANSGIVIAGVDGTPDGFEAIQDGRISGTVSQNGGAMAANGIEAAVKLLKGETLDTTEIVTDNTWIDSSNVKDYE